MPLIPMPEPPVAHVAQSAAERAIVTQINRVRRAEGLRTVRVSARLRRVAARHSREMLRRDALDHRSADGRTFTARMSSVAHPSRLGEVLAWSPVDTRDSARTVVRMWLRSPAHRAVVLDGALRRVGVGRVFGAMGTSHGFAITADFSG